MLLNYLKIAFRNLARHKIFSFINIFGLALSMSVCLQVIAIIKEQFSFDTFHQHAERIYRINTISIRKDNSTEKYASSPLPLATTLLDEYPIVEQAVRFNRSFNGDANHGQTTIPLRGLFTEPSFFTVFGFELENGDPTLALQEPNTVVLTKETAIRFFGKEDPIGKIITIEGLTDFKVTGVLRKMQAKSHLEFEALASMATLSTLPSSDPSATVLSNWNDIYSNYVYVKLKETHVKQELHTILTTIAKNKYTNLALESRDKGYAFDVQALRDITPGETLSNDMGRGMPATVLWVLAGLALIVMISACFNYANLSIARSLARAKEIGVRKVLGAYRYQVILQFISESILIALFSLLAAFFLWKILDNGLRQLVPQLELDLKEDINLYIVFVVFSVFVGILAGLFPSLYLSAFRPAQVLKNLSSVKLFSRLTIRKALIVLQFTICLVCMIIVTVIYQQTTYTLTADYGFNKENIINIHLQGMPYKHLSNEIARHNSVIKVSALSHTMGTWADSDVDVRKQQGDEKMPIRDYSIDQNFLENVGLKIVAGKNFPSDATEDREQFVIINETALQTLSLGKPAEALGKQLILGDSTLVEIIGVVKDFHFRPLTYQIGPLVLRYRPSAFQYLNVKVSGNDVRETLTYIAQVWKKFDKTHPLNYQFFEEQVRESYQEFRVMMIILGFVGFLAITIACLGLLGMAIFTAESRIKEIGIRKVLGAGIRDIVFLLSKGFMLLIVLAILLALPISYILANAFLEQFAYRIDMGISTVGLGIVLTLVLSLLTICSQTLKVALVNPVKSLRNE